MAVETPARIAVLGAGPIGLEAALYARFMGYDVDLYERGRVAENVLAWGHVRLFSPFRLNRSTLGLAALAAQDATYQPPADEALLTGHDYAGRYLLPLSQTDLLADSLHERTEVVAVGRAGPHKGDLVGSDDRADSPFRILLRQANGQESIATADVVIDTTGTYGNHNWLGQGGIPAVGELQLADRIEYGLTDILGKDRQRYAGRQVLLLGAGYSAATTAVDLAELTRQELGTHVTWVVRAECDSVEPCPIKLIANDLLPERQRLAQAANQLAAGGSPHVLFLSGGMVDSLAWDQAAGRFAVQLIGRHSQRLEVDQIVANVGYRPDSRLYAELQVHECYATQGPMKLAAALSQQTSADCLDQESCGPQTLVNPEPDFYILGSKSFGRNSKFLISIGLEQIRELFTIIGDRPDLNLYASIAKLRS
jgi:thioredoxin reductase